MERDPTELRRVELAYGAGESAVLRFTLHCGHLVASSNSQLVSLPMTESGEASGDVSRAAEAVESIQPRRHRAGSSPAGTESDDRAVGGWPFRIQG